MEIINYICEWRGVYLMADEKGSITNYPARAYCRCRFIAMDIDIFTIHTANLALHSQSFAANHLTPITWCFQCSQHCH